MSVILLPIRCFPLLQAAYRGDKGIAVIAHGGLEEVIGMVFKGDEEEKEAQRGHIVPDDITRENDLEDLGEEMGNSKPENGNFLVMVEPFPAGSVKEQTAQDFRIGNGIKQRMEDSMTVDQRFVKIRDPLCGGGGKDQEGLQQMNRKEKNPDRSFKLGDLCDIIRVQQEKAGQEVIQPQIPQVYQVADKRRVLSGIRDAVD